ncbi:hypothetical protein FRB94_012382 [Tulasnella sp. JGI-2019a]|nr:hypothetical protein FRB94_012382 [Tulasnella sp. JGI-2019a]
MASSDLEWGAQISKYARELDLACLKVNEHLPPLGPDPTDRFEQTLPTTLLIREVYVKIYEYVKKTFLKGDFDAGRGLVVLGQPGIGKTAFLYYALVRALRDRIPVIWCRAEERSAWLQFDIEGKVTPYEASRRVRRLSFFDQCPPSSTSFDDPGYIVQATSPQRARYKDWAKQSVARYWVMENWSTEEVEQEAKHRKIDTSNESKTEWKNAYTPQEAFKVIGPSARHCFTSTPKVMQDAVADFGLEVIIGGLLGSEKNFELIVRLLTGCQLTDDVYPSGFHQIFFVKHVKSDNLPTRRDHLLYEITTPAHRKIVREKILETHMEMEVTTARLFTSCPSVAGYSYEAFAQRAFSHGTEPITIYCNSVPQLVT